ncbi:MAG: tRNA (adenosine(37)-N6)-threonylcarbamoyltransferase complex ATPase subunit type 1 TsaE [Alphaproteobacteria bacterium]
MLIPLPTEADTAALASKIAPLLQAGDVLRLEGELGAGKSTLARALLQALGTQSTHIPSPTFTLVQFYDDTRLPVAHIDAYRLKSPAELAMLGLEDYAREGVLLVEWPPVGLTHTAAEAGTLTLQLAIDGEGRTATLFGQGHWVEKLQRL